MAKKTVYVEYSGGLDHEKDDKIEKVAKAFAGRSGGSGFYFPTMTRDLQFTFKDEKKAKAFAASVQKTFKTKTKVAVG